MRWRRKTSGRERGGAYILTSAILPAGFIGRSQLRRPTPAATPISGARHRSLVNYRGLLRGRDGKIPEISHFFFVDGLVVSEQSCRRSGRFSPTAALFSTANPAKRGADDPKKPGEP